MMRGNFLNLKMKKFESGGNPDMLSSSLIKKIVNFLSRKNKK